MSESAQTVCPDLVDRTRARVWVGRVRRFQAGETLEGTHGYFFEGYPGGDMGLLLSQSMGNFNSDENLRFFAATPRNPGICPGWRCLGRWPSGRHLKHFPESSRGSWAVFRREKDIGLFAEFSLQMPIFSWGFREKDHGAGTEGRRSSCKFSSRATADLPRDFTRKNRMFSWISREKGHCPHARFPMGGPGPWCGAWVRLRKTARLVGFSRKRRRPPRGISAKTNK